MTTLSSRIPGTRSQEISGKLKVIRLHAGSLTVEQRLTAAGQARFAISILRHLVRNRNRYDVALFFGAGRVAAPAILACRCLSLPAAIRPTHIDDDAPSAIRARPFGRSLARLLGQADGFVGISPLLLSDISRYKWWASRPAALIPNPVDTAVLAPVDALRRRAIRTTLGWPADERVFIFSGVISRSKGVADLLAAWRALDGSDREHARLALVGPHLNRRENLLLAREAAETPGVEPMGCVDRARVVEILQAADCFVFPTHGEGLPNALLEAMACGLPCVASELRGINDYLIEDGVRGRLVPIGDVRRLCLGMSEVLRTPQRAHAWGAAARAWIVANACVDVVAAAYERFLLELVQKRRHRGATTWSLQ